MKKVLSLILAIVIIMACVPLGAFTFTVAAEAECSGGTHKYNDFNVCTVCNYNKIFEYITYKISYSDYTVTITDCDTSISGKYVIPSKIDDKSVEKIGDSAFADCTKLTNIEIPQSVKEIGSYAFSNSGLVSFYSQAQMPYYAEKIGKGAFSGCKKLSWIFLENGITVGADAFYNCTNLKSIYLGQGTLFFDGSIDNSAFTNVNATVYYLKNTTIDYDVKNSLGTLFEFKVINNGVCGSNLFWQFDEETKTLTISGTGNFSKYLSGSQTPWYVYANDIETIIIPDSITYIPSYVFEYQTNVKTIRLPNTLKRLALNAFNDCENLNNLVIPSTLTDIDSNTAFNRCGSFTDIYYVGTEEDFKKITNNNLVYSYSDNRTVNYLVYHEKAEPTCTENGNNAYYSFEGSVINNIYDCNKNEIKDIPLISAYGHTAGAAIQENLVEPTCTEDGSYDSVVYCIVCDEEILRETIILPNLGGHTAGEVVIENIIEATNSTSGSYDEATYCTVCGLELERKNIVCPALNQIFKVVVQSQAIDDELNDDSIYNAGDEILVKVSVSQNTGVTGLSFALKFDTEVLEYVDFTLTGLFVGCAERVVVDKVADGVISYRMLTYPTAYTFTGDIFTVRFIAKTDICSNVEVEIVTPKKGSAAVNGGAYIEFEAETDSFALHTIDAAAGVVTDPTCTEDGFTTYHCAACDNDVVGNIVDALGHSPLDAVEENRVEPDCVNDGKFDTVVYCGVCDEELSRETVKIEALGHTYGDVTVIEPAYKTEGYSTHTCTVCGYEERFDFTDALTYMSGDINGDEAVNNRDLGILMRWLNGWDVEFNPLAADVDRDGFVNNRDYGVLMRWLNGWDVELK